MKLIVGLGNPGKDYINTRHNMGYFFIDNYALRHNVEIIKKKFKGNYIKLKFNNEEIILLKPTTFMNLSGHSIIKYLKYYKIKTEDILIIYDDLDINFGKIKLKKQGSNGGHNGLKSIENVLKTTEYKRIKIGISNNKNIDSKKYVLTNLSIKEKKTIDLLVPIVNNIIDDFILNNFGQAMNKYNVKNK